MAFDWKAVVSAVAPVLGSVVGGPLGGIAVKTIADALGLSDHTEEAISAAISGAKPDDLLKLKQADQQFAKDMRALDIDLERIASGDRESARDMQVQTRSKMPAVLTVLVTLGYFGVLGWMLYDPEPIKESGPLLLLLGALSSTWGMACAFWFGTTSSSQQKNQLLAQR